MSKSDQAGGFPSPMGTGRSRVPFRYVPALGTGLKVLLAIVFAAFAILSASGFYLVVLRVLEAVREQALTNAFTLTNNIVVELFR